MCFRSFFGGFRSANEFIIESQQLDGTNRKVILRGHDHCHAIAYDWIGNNMFWASSTKLEVFSLDDPTLTKTLVYTINAGYVFLCFSQHACVESYSEVNYIAAGVVSNFGESPCTNRKFLSVTIRQLFD